MPPAIARYVAAANAHDGAAAAACFTTDGLVHDEGHDHHGRAAIAAWKAEVTAKYAPVMVPTASHAAGQDVTVTARVSGTFPGSPVTLSYRFTVRDGLIAGLRVEG